MKTFASMLLLLLAVPASSFAATITTRDIAVFQAAIHSDCGAKNGRHVVLLTSTASVTGLDIQASHFDTAARLDLLARNKSQSVWPADFQCKGVKVASEARIDKLLSDRPTMQGLSKGFYKAYPGAFAILSVSLPGYSKSGETAYVFVSYACGATCGSSTVLKLKKEHGSWRVVSSSFQGIS